MGERHTNNASLCQLKQIPFQAASLERRSPGAKRTTSSLWLSDWSHLWRDATCSVCWSRWPTWSKMIRLRCIFQSFPGWSFRVFFEMIQALRAKSDAVNCSPWHRGISCLCRWERALLKHSRWWPCRQGRCEGLKNQGYSKGKWWVGWVLHKGKDCQFESSPRVLHTRKWHKFVSDEFAEFVGHPP